MMVVLFSVMSIGIGLTAAIWDSTSGTSTEYGPVVDTTDWNSWAKYFVCADVTSSNGQGIDGRVVRSYSGTNLGDVIFPTVDNNNYVIKISNTVFDSDTKKSLPETIYISCRITTIETCAFMNLVNLHKVVFAYSGYGTNDATVYSNAAVNVGDYALAGCRSLQEIVIEAGRVVNFGAGALMGCFNLTSIVYGGTRDEWLNDMTRASSWDSNTGDYTVHCSDGDITKAQMHA